MDLKKEKMRVLYSVCKGHNIKQILVTHDCHISTVIGVCRDVLNPNVKETETTGRIRNLLKQIKIQYSEKDYPELWI